MDHLLLTFGLKDGTFLLFGLSTDSDSGIPGSFFVSLHLIDQINPNGAADLCGCHDNQSIFCLSTEHLLGTGGIDIQSTMQCEHAIFDLFKPLQGLQRVIWKLAKTIHNDLARQEWEHNCT
jgi:hypothetical protein